MRIAVIGAEGQLGCDVVRALLSKRDTVHGLSHGDIEVSDINSVSRCITALNPELVVNTAAVHQLDACELEPEKAFAVNALGAINVAILAAQMGAKLIHVSTDYVFDGAKRGPYEEQDNPCPLNTYGSTKLAGEYIVRSTVIRCLSRFGKCFEVQLAPDDFYYDPNLLRSEMKYHHLTFRAK